MPVPETDQTPNIERLPPPTQGAPPKEDIEEHPPIRTKDPGPKPRLDGSRPRARKSLTKPKLMVTETQSPVPINQTWRTKTLPPQAQIVTAHKFSQSKMS